MVESASRFFPLYDQRNSNGKLRYHGHGQQCWHHALHNILDACIRFLDPEFLNRVIQTVRSAKNFYNEAELMDAIDHLFSELPEFRRIDESTDFFKHVREGIAKQALAGNGVSLEDAKREMGYTEKKGAETAETCAKVRWATTGKAAAWLAIMRLGYAFGFLRIGGIALNVQVEVDAAVAIFSHDGFLSDNFQDLMLAT
jgi:hypothetical protein